MKKAILAALGLAFAIFVSSCEGKASIKKKEKVCEVKPPVSQPLPTLVEKEKHHSKW